MKQRLKAWLLAIPGFEAVCRSLTRHHVRAIMYHRFSEEPTADPRFVDVASLRRQMLYLTAHHPAWTPDRHVACASQGQHPAEACPVVVTVDDGYHDFYGAAFPVFREFGIPATLFVTTGFVDRAIWFWWDKLEHIIFRAANQQRTLEISGRAIRLDVDTQAGRKHAWHQVADRCRFLPNIEKETVIQEVADLLGVSLPADAPPEFRPVTWSQLREMQRAGIRLGAHTVHHPILTRVTSAEAQLEISLSQERLQRESEIPIHWFCYPQGGPADYNAEIQSLVKKAGYSLAYIAYQNLEVPDDSFAISRYCVAADMCEFRWILCGAEYLNLRLRSMLGCSTALGRAYWAGSAEESQRTGNA